jgi:hypothetical protein
MEVNNMIIGLQLTAIIFSLIMIYLATINYQRKEISVWEVLAWWIIWVVTIIIVIFPSLLSDFARSFSITRVFDLMVVGGFILVISLTYRSYIKMKRLDKKMEQLVRETALRDLKNEKK